MHAVIHGNYEYTDPETGNSSNYVVGKALSEFQRGDQGWHQYTVAFDYASYSPLNQTPAYILITIATNKNPGTGAATDNLYCDDIEMIYNARLSDLKVGGTTIAEFNPDVTDYYITTPHCYGDTLPVVTATTASSLAGTPVITQATSTIPLSTIAVTNGSVTKTYQIHFIIINTLPPTVIGNSRCGEGSILLNATPDTITNTCRWYDNITDGNLLYTENSYSPTVNQSTTYYVSSYNTVWGCESERVPITGTIYPTYQADTIQFTICGNGYYNFFGRQLNQTGIYDTVFPTIHGCDSLVILNLTVGNAYQNTIAAEICEGESYQQNGFNEDSIGVYTHTLSASNGCDSIVTLHLTVNPVHNITFFDTICQGTAYSANGFNLPTQNISGTTLYSLSLTSVHGCDSLVNLSLTVNPTYLFVTNDTICSNNSYQWRGNNYNLPGIYYDSLVTESGCDSIFMLSLTIFPQYSIEISDTVFSGETYDQNGFNIISTGAGIVHDTLFLYSQEGCDSTIMLTLAVITGIWENDLTGNVLLYPNPSHSHITISSTNDNLIQDIQIMNLTGKIVRQTVNIAKSEAEINISDIASGLYIVRILLKKGIVSKKITIQ